MMGCLQASTGRATMTMEKEIKANFMMKAGKNQQWHECPYPSKCGNQGIDRQYNDLPAKS